MADNGTMGSQDLAQQAAGDKKPFLEPFQALRTRRKSFTGKPTAEFKEKLARLNTHVFHGTSTRDVSDLFELGEEVGKGAFGVVREAVDIATGTMFCCKSIPRQHLSAEMFEDIKLEAEIMMHLRGHPNVVEIMGVFQDDTHIHIVEEMCTGGDLYSKLTQTPVPYTEKDVASIMRTVLTVLQHCHDMGVIYRDCKPDNFLLSSKGPDAVIKATDFGISKFLKKGDKIEEFAGTPSYMAPEVFDMSYSYAADVWSAGVMMFWVLSGDFPFKGRNKMELARKVYVEQPSMTSAVWDQVTQDAKDILKRMLEKDPNKRGTPSDLLQHKWFKEMAGAKVKPLGNIVLQRMRAFCHMHEFKKEVMRHIAHHLDESYLVGLRSMFAAMDKDNSGELSTDEVILALESQGVKIDPVEVKTLMDVIDDDHNGQISFLEFVSATINSSILERKDLLQEAFDHYDVNKDGSISRAELEAALRTSNISEKKIVKILAEVDKNSDGQIDFAEFCGMMLESNEQGKDGFKLRWRVKKAAIGALFSSDKKSQLPVLGRLASTQNLASMASSGMSKSAAGLNLNNVSQGNAPATHGTLRTSAAGPLGSILRRGETHSGGADSPRRADTQGGLGDHPRRQRSTSVAGFALAELAASGKSFSQRLRRVSLTLKDTQECAGMADEDPKALARSMAASTMEASKLSAFFSKMSPFKMLSQGGPKSNNSISSPNGATSGGSPTGADSPCSTPARAPTPSCTDAAWKTRIPATAPPSPAPPRLNADPSSPRAHPVPLLPMAARPPSAQMALNPWITRPVMGAGPEGISGSAGGP